jgi:hypothetical protein
MEGREGWSRMQFEQHRLSHLRVGEAVFPCLREAQEDIGRGIQGEGTEAAASEADRFERGADQGAEVGQLGAEVVADDRDPEGLLRKPGVPPDPQRRQRVCLQARADGDVLPSVR